MQSTWWDVQGQEKWVQISRASHINYVHLLPLLLLRLVFLITPLAPSPRNGMIGMTCFIVFILLFTRFLWPHWRNWFKHGSNLCCTMCLTHAGPHAGCSKHDSVLFLLYLKQWRQLLFIKLLIIDYIPTHFAYIYNYMVACVIFKKYIFPQTFDCRMD